MQILLLFFFNDYYIQTWIEDLYYFENIFIIMIRNMKNIIFTGWCKIDMKMRFLVLNMGTLLPVLVKPEKQCKLTSKRMT